MSFSRPFTKYFNRRPGTPRIMRGLTSMVRRKNIERMDDRVSSMNYESAQRFISEPPGDEQPLLSEVARQANRLLGGQAESALYLDEKAFSGSRTAIQWAIGQSGQRSSGGECSRRMRRACDVHRFPIVHAKRMDRGPKELRKSRGALGGDRAWSAREMAVGTGSGRSVGGQWSALTLGRSRWKLRQLS